MKTIGLIGGITPKSTILYYQVLNDLAATHFGESHSCKVIINSVDFSKISKYLYNKVSLKAKDDESQTTLF